MPAAPAKVGISPKNIIPKSKATIDLYEFIGPKIDKSPFSRAETKKPFPKAPNTPPSIAYLYASAVISVISVLLKNNKQKMLKPKYVKKFTLKGLQPFMVKCFCKTFENGLEKILKISAVTVPNKQNLLMIQLPL